MFLAHVCYNLFTLWNLFQVIWKRLFNKNSAAEKRTLYQLRNLLHRSAVPLDPGDNMKASEDFLQVVLHAHIVAAAETILAATDNSRISLAELSQAVVKKFVQIAVPLPSSANAPKVKDTVFLYATEVLALGLIWENFHDAIKEGDGDRLVRVWKFLLLIFKAAKRKNYSIEALNLQLQINYTLSA